jgi:hypothetical protein
VNRASYTISYQGLLEIHVTSDPAMTSDIIRLDVTTGAAAIITIIAPSPIPTEIVHLTPTQTQAPALTPTPEPSKGDNPGTLDWLISNLLIWAGGVGVFYLGRNLVSFRWGVRWGLATVLGGLITYSSLALAIPVSLRWDDPTGRIGLIIILFLGMLAGWGIGWIWRQVVKKRTRSTIGGR